MKCCGEVDAALLGGLTQRHPSSDQADGVGQCPAIRTHPVTTSEGVGLIQGLAAIEVEFRDCASHAIAVSKTFEQGLSVSLGQ